MQEENMKDDDIDRILFQQDEIVPSSGFAASVMDAVRREASAPPPIPFPWKRALPIVLLAASRSRSRSWSPDRLSLSFMSRPCRAPNHKLCQPHPSRFHRSRRSHFMAIRQHLGLACYLPGRGMGLSEALNAPFRRQRLAFVAIHVERFRLGALNSKRRKTSIFLL